MRTYTAPDLRGRFVFRSREGMSMIIVLRPNASEHDLEQIVAKVAALGLTPHVSRGVTRSRPSPDDDVPACRRRCRPSKLATQACRG